MKIKEYKCGCGHDEFFFADKGNQKGIYCSYCGKWLKWADKNEQNLDMKQELQSSSRKPNKWIPVSERLPEESGVYLCSYDYDIVDTSYFDIRMNEFNVFHEQVTAWMLLPTPYQLEIPTGAEGGEE